MVKRDPRKSRDPAALSRREATQGGNGTLPDNRAVAEETNLRPAGDDAGLHHATSDGTLLGNPEDLADFGFAGDHFFELGIKHADHRLLDIFEQLVDDLVRADLDFFLLGQLAGLAVRTDVEAEDRRVGRVGQ